MGTTALAGAGGDEAGCLRAAGVGGYSAHAGVTRLFALESAMIPAYEVFCACVVVYRRNVFES